MLGITNRRAREGESLIVKKFGRNPILNFFLRALTLGYPTARTPVAGFAETRKSKVLVCALDQTILRMQMADKIQRKYGTKPVEDVTFIDILGRDDAIRCLNRETIPIAELIGATAVILRIPASGTPQPEEALATTA